MKEKNPVILLAATMDTKPNVATYFADRIKERGVTVLIADIGTSAKSPKEADIKNTQIATMGGGAHVIPCVAKKRMDVFGYMSDGLKSLTLDLYAKGEINGLVAIGGSGGAALAAPAMWALPFGVTKMLVSTVSCGNTAQFTHGRDIVLVNPVADLMSLNEITRDVLSKAAGALAGMLLCDNQPKQTKRAIALTSFGVTDPCVHECVKQIERAGYEAVVFHARGVSGGQAMEEYIGKGMFAGVIDLTTTEITDEIVGGILSAGSDRLTAGGKADIPYIIAPGALDVVNFGPPPTIPEKYAGRLFLRHSPAGTLMRANREEMVLIARFMCEKLKSWEDNYRVFIPLKGFSQYDDQGRDFFDEDADRAYTEEMLSSLLKDRIKVVNLHINDIEFAETMVNELFTMLKNNGGNK